MRQDIKLQELAKVVASSKRVITISGAGISTSTGIPDFKSLSSSQPGVRTRDLFHYSALSHPSDGPALIRLCTELFEYAQNSQPTETHRFLKDLSRSGQLVRAYTQNIDHLEEKAGLSTDLSKGTGAWVSSDLAHSAVLIVES